MADVVFIIGAGCSVHAGAPVMSNFLDRARELYAAGVVKDREAEFQLAFRIISELQRVHSKARLDINNIESVFSAVDLARTLGKLPGFDIGEIDAALKALVWVIVRTLERSIKFQTQEGRMRGTAEYMALAELLKDMQSRQPRLSAAVLTFNYDVCADISFVQNGVSFTYGLDDTAGVLPLLKLHGSLNWGRKKVDRSIVPYSIANYVNKYVLSNYFPSDGSPEVSTDISLHMAKELREIMQDVENEPVIVPPTWSKGEHHREIAKVWARAARELEGATHIFILGYSLPETDQFFRLLFALGTQGRSILSKVVVFDPDRDRVKRRFNEMLGGAALDRFEAWPERFGGGLSAIRGMLF